MVAPVIRSTLEAIGDTPVVRLQKVVPPGSADVYVKLESFNSTGSYKDRMALSMIEEAEARGELRPGMTVVEYTAGSTGSSLALICAVKGYRFEVVTSDAFSEEKLKTMQAFGAHLNLIPSDDGNTTAELVERMMEEAGRLAARGDTYFTNQLHNRDSLVGYRGLGEEIIKQVGERIDVFAAAVGTAGLLMGVSVALKEAGLGARIVAFEPAASPVISTGESGSHHVEGIGIGFVPPLLDPELYDEAMEIEEEEARAMAHRLAEEEGVFAGTSSGLNVAGAIRIARELGPGHSVVTVAVDTGLKYVADLYTQSPPTEAH
ncbi:MAG: PLP-dependent cysteine synthase family protein [Actinomycetota bacterium]